MKKYKKMYEKMAACQQMALDGKFEEAVYELEKLIALIDESFDYENAYHLSYNDFFELCIYNKMFGNKEVIPAKFEYNILYKIYGFCLFKLGKIDDAEAAFQKSIEWNPISTKCLLEFGEIKRVKGKYDEFFSINKDILKYAYTVDDIAMAYRNIAAYYSIKNELQTSAAIFLMANSIKPYRGIERDLAVIQARSGESIRVLDKKGLEELFKSIDLQLGVNREIVDIALETAELAKKENKEEIAKLCYSILMDLGAKRG